MHAGYTIQSLPSTNVHVAQVFVVGVVVVVVAVGGGGGGGVAVLFLTDSHYQVRRHRTSSSHCGAEQYTPGKKHAHTSCGMHHQSIIYTVSCL